MNTVVAVKDAPRFLQKAIDSLKTIGIVTKEPSAAPITALISRIADVDQNRSIVIARTLAQQEVFDSVVADQISQMNIGTRFEKITEGFDSIREDAKRMVVQSEKEKPGIGDRISNIVMKITRGDIANRFDDIKKTFNEVVSDVQVQVERERNILEAYADYRYAIKEAEILSREIQDKIELQLFEGQKALDEANAAVTASLRADDAEKARLQLSRDETSRALANIDGRYQIAKDLAENLSLSYNVTEVTMAKLAQSHAAKDRIYQQSVSFFATNSSVLSALKATYTGVLGLNESTKTLAAFGEGISKSLESIAELGTSATEAAIKVGYGPIVRADSVRMLVDSVVSFQENSVKAIAEMRELSTKNAKEIRDHVEEGKERIAKLTSQKLIG